MCFDLEDYADEFFFGTSADDISDDEEYLDDEEYYVNEDYL